jgi:hypothetical protein
VPINQVTVTEPYTGGTSVFVEVRKVCGTQLTENVSLTIAGHV